MCYRPSSPARCPRFGLSGFSSLLPSFSRSHSSSQAGLVVAGAAGQPVFALPPSLTVSPSHRIHDVDDDAAAPANHNGFCFAPSRLLLQFYVCYVFADHSTSRGPNCFFQSVCRLLVSTMMLVVLRVILLLFPPPFVFPARASFSRVGLHSTTFSRLWYHFRFQ